MPQWNNREASIWIANNLEGVERETFTTLSDGASAINEQYSRVARKIWGDGEKPGFGMYFKGTSGLVSVWWIGWSGGGRNLVLSIYATNSGRDRTDARGREQFESALQARFPQLPEEVKLDLSDVNSADSRALLDGSERLARVIDSFRFRYL